MRLFARNLLVLAVAGTVTALIFGGGGVVLADDRDDSHHLKVTHKGKVMVVTVDEDGERHDEVFEIDGDGPRPFLGVHLEEGSDGGAVVMKVVEDSGAERAGLREGDVIVAVDGEELDGSWSLTKKVMSLEPGDRMRLEIVRDGDRETLTAELGEREDMAGLFIAPFDSEEFEQKMEQLHERLAEMDINLEGLQEHLEDVHIRIDEDIDIPELQRHIIAVKTNRPLLGVQLVQPTGELREHLGGPEDAGVLVSKVLDGMPAEKAGVEVGDLIVAVDGEQVEDAAELISALRGKSGKTVELEVTRDGRPLTLDVSLPVREAEAE